MRSSVLASLLLTLWVGCALEDAGRTGGGKDGGQGSGGTDPTGAGGSSNPATTGTGGSTTTGTGGSTTTGTGGSTTTGTGGTGGSTTTGTGGTGGSTTTGTGGSTTGTGGAGGTAGATTTTGTGGATTGTGGAGGAAGTGGATTGTGGTGGSGVDSGSKGGAAGTGGTGMPDSGTGSDAGLLDVARALDGKVITLRCGTDSGMRVCNNRPAGSTTCPTTNTDPVLLGMVNTNETVKFGGTPGTTYNVTIHIQGVVEAKPYQNGMDTSLDGTNGWYVGGAPNHNGNAYNVYAIRVASPKQDYFLNSIAISGNNRLNHAAYIIDYTVTLPIQGGSDVTLVASDSNCSAIKNCAEPVNEQMCNPHTVPNLEPKIASGLPMAQPWPGQFAGIAVKSVTQ